MFRHRSHGFRLLPWDHAPGAVLLREAGGAMRYLDGNDYVVDGRDGLVLAARRRGDWERLAREVFRARSALHDPP